MVHKHCCYGPCRSDSRYQHSEHMQGVFFLPFPKPARSLAKCKVWVRACQRKEFTVKTVTKHTYICSLHFIGGNGPTMENPDPIPFHKSKQIDRLDSKRKAPTLRTSLPKKHKELKVDTARAAEALLTLASTEGPAPTENVHDIKSVGIQCAATTRSKSVSASQDMFHKDTQTARSLDSNYVAVCVQNTVLKNKIKRLEIENNVLKAKPVPLTDAACDVKIDLDSAFSFEDIKHDSSKFKFHTGLTYPQFVVLWRELGPAACNLNYRMSDVKDEEPSPDEECGADRKLSPQNELFLTLIRLRLCLLHNDLAHRFCISTSMVSIIVLTWVQLLYKHFSGFRPAMFPARRISRRNWPKCLNKYKKIRAIINCIETYVPKPADVEKQGVLFSSTNSHCTYTTLVSMAPNGAITFVSDAFEGSLSDVDIVERSGFLEKLDEGDLILAGSDFTIRDLLWHKKVDLNIPPEEEAQSRTVAKIRTHLKRAIKKMKTFRILKCVLPLALAPLYSQIVFVVGCLVNFQEPLVK